MMLQAVDFVVEKDYMLKAFQIPYKLWKPIKESWKRKDSDLQGRFDFVFDENADVKMLEYNADTPSI